MKNILIHILYPIKDNSWGGGNQFLKSLRAWLQNANLYEDNPEKADVILFNSNPDSLYSQLDILIRLKNDFNKIVINRVDGPINYHRDFGKYIDNANSVFANLCDGIVYQSDWSRQKSIPLKIANKKYAIIINAPDKYIFKRGSDQERILNKVNIITTSWSKNVNKGFNVYEWLDTYLDFDKVSFRFIGNCPIRFKNIKTIDPIDSDKIAEHLIQSHIYLTASRKDACPNSLIEAMHCGLPAIAFNDGGHPEIVGKGGELFDIPEQIPGFIDKIVADYEGYRSRINLPSIDEVGQSYYDFCRSVYDDVVSGKQKLKKIKYYHRVKIRGWLELYSLRKKLRLNKAQP